MGYLPLYGRLLCGAARTGPVFGERPWPPLIKVNGGNNAYCLIPGTIPLSVPPVVTIERRTAVLGDTGDVTQFSSSDDNNGTDFSIVFIFNKNL